MQQRSMPSTSAQARDAAFFDSSNKHVPFGNADLKMVLFDDKTDKNEVAATVHKLAKAHPNTGIKVVTGVHGGTLGQTVPEPKFLLEDQPLEDLYSNVTVSPFDDQASLTSDDSITVAAYCYSDKNSSLALPGVYVDGIPTGRACPGGCRFKLMAGKTIDLVAEDVNCDRCRQVLRPTMIKGNNCQWSLERRVTNAKNERVSMPAASNSNPFAEMRLQEPGGRGHTVKSILRALE